MSKSVLLCIIFLSFAQINFAQYSDLSYSQLNDSIKAYQFAQPSLSLKFGELLFEKAIIEDNNKEIGTALSAKSTSFYLLKDYNKAELESKKYLRHAYSIDDKDMIIIALILRSNINMMLSRIDLSHQYLEEALAVANAAESDLLRETVLSQLAGYYDLSGDHEKAIHSRKQTIEIFENKPLDSLYTAKAKMETLVFAYTVLAGSYVKKKTLDSANIYNEKVKSLAAEQDSCKLIYYYTTKGEIAIENGKFLDAKKYFNKSLEYCPPSFGLFNLNMDFRFGRAEFGLKNYAETVNILQLGLNNYTVSEAEEAYMDEYYKLLAQAYKEIGDFEQANFYFEKYIHTQNKLSALKGDLSASIKAKEIEDFKAALEAQKADKEATSNKYYYVGLVALCAIVALLLLLLRFYKIKKRNEITFKNLLLQIEQSKKEKFEGNSQIALHDESGMAAELVTQIITGLQVLEQQQYYLKQECTSYNVAKKIKTNTSYLSKVINIHFNKNFNAYINDLRINYAILKLKDESSFRAYSIQSIAEEVGYKSADSFAKYFKLETGLNPSFYIKQLEVIKK